jgi:hypothetical protein
VAGHVAVPAAAPTMELMRAAIAALAALGYGALVAALGVSLAAGDGSEVGWILVGPLPFCVVRPHASPPHPRDNGTR